MKTTSIFRPATIVLVTIAVACTQYATPPPVEEDVTRTESRLQTSKHVLWINLEGAGGGDLAKNALPDNGAIKALLPRAHYAWEGLEAEHWKEEATPEEEHAVACASILTGNMPIRHGIADETYTSEQVFDPNFDEAMKAYPGFFQYISDHDKNLKTLAITPWKTQNEVLLNKAGLTVTSASDEETLDRALKELVEENYSVVYLSFRGALDGGKQGGWRPDNENYINAMKTLDDRVGQLLDSIRARPNAYFEDWLVIVTSNHGGTADGNYGGSSREERAMFGIFHFAHFSREKEMDAEMLEVLNYDQSFLGVVIDSNTYIRNADRDIVGVEVYRQIYSPDSLAGGMTVEYIMSARAGVNRSYIPGDQNGVTLFEKTQWKMGLDHTYCAGWGSFFGKSTSQIRDAGYFANPLIATFATTMNFRDVKAYSLKETIAESVDKWGNAVPAHDRYTPKRSGMLDVYSYYNGDLIGAGNTGLLIDQNENWFVDNSNITICDGMRWSRRNLLEIRIWNKQLTDAEIKLYHDQLRLTPSTCPEYDHLIGYWQFYKGEEGQYIEKDSLVVNQIKTVRKRVRVSNADVEQEVATEPIRLRKKDANGLYVPVTSDDIHYAPIPNTLPRVIATRGRLMESALVVPTILEWMGVPFPVEGTRESSSGFSTSKLDGICKPYDPVTKTFPWAGLFLGDYTTDLEWRDYE